MAFKNGRELSKLSNMANTVIWKKQCMNLFTCAGAASDNCFEKVVCAEDIFP